MRAVLRPSALLAAVLLAASPVLAQPENQEQCLHLINRVLTLVYSDLEEAEREYERALDSCEIGVDRQHRLRWALASQLTQTADSKQNRCERYLLGNKATEAWKSYVSWYRREDVYPQLAPENRRIQTATQFLLSAITIRGELNQCAAAGPGLSEIFTVFSTLPADALNAATVDDWLNWLWRCPDWVEKASAPDRNYNWVNQKHCDLNVDWSCDRYWSEYRGFLATLLDAKPKGFDPGTLESYKGRHLRLERALSCEER